MKTEKQDVEGAAGVASTPAEGVFVGSLKRNNRQIRDDRATAIAEDAELVYRRAVEDLQIKLTRLLRDREALLDLSPANAMSLMPAADFKADEFVGRELRFAKEIRETEIMLDVMRTRYNHLFGKEINV